MNLTVQPRLYSTAGLKKSQQNKNYVQNYATNQMKSRQIAFKGNPDQFNYGGHYNENLNAQTGLFGKKKRAREITDAQARAFYEGQAGKLETERLENAKLEAAIAARNEEIKDLRNDLKKIADDLEKNRNDKVKTDELMKQNKELLEKLNKKEAARDAEDQQVHNFKKDYENATAKEANKGWDRVAGNEYVKEKLNESFIRKLAAEKSGMKVQMPNGILFYGPQSTGKTLFARAFGQQAERVGQTETNKLPGCNYKEIDMLQSNEDIIKELLSSAQQSKKDYEATGKRTIILLDEFDSVASPKVSGLGKVLENENIPKIKNFLQKCAEEYKCTIFMTTNFPLNLDSAIVADQRIPVKVFLGPPEEDDAAEVFKYYLKDTTDQTINHDKLAEEVMKARETNQAFSPARIKKVVETTIEEATKTAQKVTQNGLIKTIQKLGPDITPTSMNQFAKEIAEMAKKAV